MTTVKRINTVELHANDVSSLERVGEFLVIVGLLLISGFFVLHQTRGTGFFTDKFGSPEMILLYAPLLLALLNSGVQILTGQHNPARPFEAASSLLLGVAAIWYLIVFPFDFAHLADVLPEGLRFLLSWVTNDIGKIPLIIQAFVGPITAILVIRKFIVNRG